MQSGLGVRGSWAWCVIISCQHEVEAILPVETPESSLENDAELFTEEEGNQDETFELPTHEQLPRQPIELKPLPSGLCYASVNDNT